MRKLTRSNGIVKSRFLVMASKMPGMSHWPDRDQEFDYRKSDAAKWLLEQPDTWRWMFEKARDMGVIVFDAKTKLWHGVDTEDGRRLMDAKEPAKPAGL